MPYPGAAHYGGEPSCLNKRDPRLCTQLGFPSIYTGPPILTGYDPNLQKAKEKLAAFCGDTTYTYSKYGYIEGCSQFMYRTAPASDRQSQSVELYYKNSPYSSAKRRDLETIEACAAACLEQSAEYASHLATLRWPRAGPAPPGYLASTMSLAASRLPPRHFSLAVPRALWLSATDLT